MKKPRAREAGIILPGTPGENNAITDVKGVEVGYCTIIKGEPEDYKDPYLWAPEIIAFIQANRLHWTAWSFHPGATPRVISDWDFTPTPFWGAFVRTALRGYTFIPGT